MYDAIVQMAYCTMYYTPMHFARKIVGGFLVDVLQDYVINIRLLVLNGL